MLAILGSTASQGGNAPIDIYKKGDLKTALCGGWYIKNGRNTSNYIYLESCEDDDSTMYEGSQANTKDYNKVASLGRNVVEVEFRINPYKEHDHKDIRILIQGGSGSKRFIYAGYSGSDIADGDHTVRLYVNNPLTDLPINKVEIRNESIYNRISIKRVTLIDGKTEA